MSIEAVSWALMTPLGGNQKVLLIGIANHAHPDGSEAYPSLPTLATYAHCDRSTARRNVRKLVADGWLIEDGIGPKGQAKYRLPLGGLQNATGGKVEEGGLQNGGKGGGIAVPPEPSFNRPRNRTENEQARARVWAHYQKRISDRFKLDATRRLIIDAALAVRTEVECCAAIDGLARSEYHLGNGYRDIKYALRGGGRTPQPDATVDRMAKAAETNGNGHANGTRLRDMVYDGRTWDELTPSEQANVREMVMMGRDPTQSDDPVPLTLTGNGFTGKTFLEGS